MTRADMEQPVTRQAGYLRVSIPMSPCWLRLPEARWSGLVRTTRDDPEALQSVHKGAPEGSSWDISLALHHTERPQPYDSPGEPSSFARCHDLVHVLVGDRRLLSQPTRRAGPNRDARGLELAAHLVAAHLPSGGVA